MEDWDFVVLACWHLPLLLAAAAATLELQNEILPSRLRQLSDQCRGEALHIWSKVADVPEPVYPADKIQKVCDAVITSNTYSNILNVLDQRPTQPDC